jgi:hypothetical protein
MQATLIVPDAVLDLLPELDEDVLALVRPLSRTKQVEHQGAKFTGTMRAPGSRFYTSDAKLTWGPVRGRTVWRSYEILLHGVNFYGPLGRPHTTRNGTITLSGLRCSLRGGW